MSDRAEKRVLAAILVVFVALAGAYSVVVPLFEASDELWHYPMVRVLAETWQLPVQDPAEVGPWRQEGSQPPLYYLLAASATAWIDTSDMAEVRHLNVHVDNGVATADGNTNLVVHDPELESLPWRGTTLAVHVARGISVALSGLAVYLTWRIVRIVVPGRPCIALAATAIHAFTPMYVFISGSVNNDNLVIPLSSLALLMLIRLARSASQRPSLSEGADYAARERGRSGRLGWLRGGLSTVPVFEYVVLGVVLGLAALTKTSSLALTVITAIVVAGRAVRRRSWVEFIAGGVATLFPALLVAGWWYVRNVRLYGDISGLNVFIEILGKRDVPADIAQLWRERFSFAAGYWGNFGGLNVPLPGWAYSVLNWAAIAAAAGLVLVAIRTLVARSRAHAGRAVQDPWPGPFDAWALALCILWGLGVAIPWSRWAAVTWSSQGRLIFSAIPVWSLLLTVGLAAWFPRTWARWVLLGFVLVLLALCVAAVACWIPQAYAGPGTKGASAEPSHPLPVDFAPDDGAAPSAEPVMSLHGYDLATGEVAPGDTVTVTLYWEGLGATSQDSTVFVHLLGEGDLVVAQRDTFPGMGLLSTTRLVAGQRWQDEYVLQVPDTAFSPDSTEIELGIYATDSGARLRAIGPGGEDLGDQVRFGAVRVLAPPDPAPNPIDVNFGGRMGLVGYDLDRRVAGPGEVLELTLYWNALRAMNTDYTVSAQLVDSQQRKAAQLDSWPMGGSAPTSSWAEGQILVDVIPLPVSLDAEPGPYDVRVAVYALSDGEIRHLPVIPSDGRMIADHIVLTQVRIVDP